MNEMNEAQELFETISRHLFAQGERSTKKIGLYDRCVYRGNNGLKCAVGAIIPDDQYDPDFDTKNMTVSRITCDLPSAELRGLFQRNINLLSYLQSVHDNAANWETSENMMNALIEVGDDFELKVEFLDGFYFGMAA